ncbi:MAG: hypothetical protein AAFY58_07235, partial [Planctomycetota bacterium]
MSTSADNSTGPGSRFVRVAIQVVGFLAGLAMLGWCANMALKEENRTQLERLLDASPASIAALVGLCAATLIFNGLIFWAQIRPVRRLRASDVIATNAIATLMNYLPFKMSLVSRVVIHNRRDGVPVLTIGAWLGAVAVTFFGTVGVVVGAAMLLGGVTITWWALVLAGLIAWVVVQWAGARLFAGERGLARVHQIADRFGPAILGKLMRSGAFVNLHAGLDMLAHPGATGTAVAIRLADMLGQAARLVVAASVLGETLGWASAIAAGHFFIGVVSPFGMLGTREAGTAGLAGLLTLAAGASAAEAEAAAASFAVALLMVTAVEAVVTLGAGGLAVAWLRPDRLLKRGVPGESDPL